MGGLQHITHSFLAVWPVEIGWPIPTSISLWNANQCKKIAPQNGTSNTQKPFPWTYLQNFKLWQRNTNKLEFMGLTPHGKKAQLTRSCHQAYSIQLGKSCMPTISAMQLRRGRCLKWKQISYDCSPERNLMPIKVQLGTVDCVEKRTHKKKTSKTCVQ